MRRFLEKVSVSWQGCLERLLGKVAWKPWLEVAQRGRMAQFPPPGYAEYATGLCKICKGLQLQVWLADA